MKHYVRLARALGPEKGEFVVHVCADKATAETKARLIKASCPSADFRVLVTKRAPVFSNAR